MDMDIKYFFCMDMDGHGLTYFFSMDMDFTNLIHVNFYIKPLCSDISSGWSLRKIGSIVFVCLCVCSSIFAPGARTAELIGTSGISFDAPEQRKDDGANRGAIGATWQVPRPTCQPLQKKC